MMKKLLVTGSSGLIGSSVAESIHARHWEIHGAPRQAEVYNLGGGRENSGSLLEAFARAEAITDKPQKTTYVEKAREGDHICYNSDLSKIQAHFPGYSSSRSLADIFQECASAWETRLSV